MSYSVTVTIVWCRRVWRFATFRTVAMTVAYLTDLELPDRLNARAVDVPARVMVEQVPDGMDAERALEDLVRLRLPSSATPNDARETRIDLQDRRIERELHGGFLIGHGFYHARDGAPPLAPPPARRVVRAFSTLLAAGGDVGGSGAGPCPLRSGRRRNATTAPLLPTHVADLPTFDTDAFRRLMMQLRGTPVVVNVWAAWCGPCKAEAPLLYEASQTYGDRVQFLGVDIVDSLDGARGFIADHGLTYPSLFDPSGAIRDSLGMIGNR